jgi:peptidoglycan hydrolase-like protein with peptidoglycan-binding domain
MRTYFFAFLCVVTCGLLLWPGTAACAASGAAAKKGQSTTASASKSATAHSTTSTTKKKTTTKKRRRSTKFVPKQKAPTADRITEIQTALSHGGYYQGDPNGRWDSSTVAAMQKFQSANGIDATGKLDAPSLQKLGLGSDIAGVSAPRPRTPEGSAAPASDEPASKAPIASTPAADVTAAATISAAPSVLSKPAQQ